VVCAYLLEGPEQASSLGCKCIAQHISKPQLRSGAGQQESSGTAGAAAAAAVWLAEQAFALQC
jgi:hypothetical protein